MGVAPKPIQDFLAEQRGQEPGESEPDPESDHDRPEPPDDGADDHPGFGRTEGAHDADVTCATGRGKGHHTVKADSGEQQGGQSQGAEQGAQYPASVILPTHHCLQGHDGIEGHRRINRMHPARQGVECPGRAPVRAHRETHIGGKPLRQRKEERPAPAVRRPRSPPDR